MNRFSEITLCGPLEVKHHRDKSQLAKPVTYRIQNVFPLRGKPAKDQYTLLSNRIDHVSDLVVMHQDIHELGKFQIVYCHCTRYDLVRLNRQFANGRIPVSLPVLL